MNYEIGWNSVTEFDVNNVTDANVFRCDGQLFAITHHFRVLGHQIGERVHDLAALAFDGEGKTSDHGHQGHQDDSQPQLK